MKTASQRQPTVLVLDDLRLDDRASLLLLQILGRVIGESRPLIVGTCRDVYLSRQHPLSETLVHLTREQMFRRELLKGLNQEDSAWFIEATAGIHPPQQLVETLHTHTEGNPFSLSVVIQLLAERAGS